MKHAQTALSDAHKIQ